MKIEHKMQTIMWRKRRVFIIILISMILYLFLRNKNYTYTIDSKLSNVKAERVWEFIADFSNMKKHLIPSIYNFSIVAESGNYDHWKYSVGYEETLPVWPFLDSVGVGHYSVRTDNGGYLISSVHNICFFHGWFCSKSQCDFHMNQINKQDTLYREEIIYECPPLLSHWCYHVADYTRKDFINNLVNYFKPK